MTRSYNTKRNLKQAWKWIKSNPDRVIKDDYGMRTSYQTFTVIEKDLINQIYQELRSKTYKPEITCKIYLPKPSGGLRPYTILTIKDQIVYQSIINVIAERLSNKIRNHYYTKVFSNIYAGNESIWFYKKWKDGYSKFSKSAKKAFDSGQIYMAGFDLVACYDSIDHKVLQHYLKELKIPQDTINTLLNCLSIWTSTDHNERIYQSHGIPQGPISSGLLSEVVLTSFDPKRKINGVTYIRYVDDILFFAKNKEDLRFELVRMDKICKKIGLFPQTSKINIRKIKNIEEEIKNISGISEKITITKNDDCLQIIKELTPSYKIKDISKFRYYVAITKPTSPLINRLWKIFANHPEIYPQLCKAIINSGKLNKNSEKLIASYLSKRNPYINIQASLIEVLCKIKLSKEQVNKFTKIIKKDYGTSKTFRNKDSRMTAVTFEFLYKYNKLTKKQISYICTSPFWYTRREISRFLKNKDSNLIKNYLNDNILDVQLSASRNIVSNDIQIPNLKLPSLVNSYFKNNGLLTQTNSDPCKINLFLGEMLNEKININWKKILNRRYKQALKIIAECNSSKTTNISAWICELDTFNEIIIMSIFDKDNSLGKHSTNYGATLKQNKFKLKYPILSKNCKAIHDRRIKTLTAHAYQQKTKLPTTPFKYKEMPSYIKKEIAIIKEISKLHY